MYVYDLFSYKWVVRVNPLSPIDVILLPQKLACEGKVLKPYCCYGLWLYRWPKHLQWIPGSLPHQKKPRLLLSRVPKFKVNFSLLQYEEECQED